MSEPLRVLFVIPSFVEGGAEKLLCDIAIEMQHRPGLQVKVVSFDTPNTYSDLTRQFDLHCLKSKVFLSPFRKNKFQLDEYSTLLNEYKPHIIHSHLFEAEIISRSVDYSNTKYFSHCHDNMRQFKSLSWSTLTDKTMLVEYYERVYLFNRYRKTGGTHFIAVSRDAYDYFSEVLPRDLRHITLLPNAINFAQYNLVNNARSPREIKLINTGTFIPKKNQIFLLEILKVLKQKGYHASLTLLGSGDGMQAVRERANEYGLNNQVTFTGNVSRVQDYLKEATIYVHSAYHEAFGLVLLEAMAAGLPVVSLDGRGNRGLVRDGENGFFITEQNAGLFADKILLLTNNDSLYQQMSAQAVEFARGFHIKNYVDRLLSLYNEPK